MVSKTQKRISVLIAGLVLLTACSDKLDTKIERGLELVQQESYQQAIKLLQEVLQDNPKNIKALILLQAAFNKAEDYERSIVQGEHVLKIDPNNQTAYYNLAVAYSRLERYEYVISNYESLLSLSPENIEANVQLGIVFAEQGRYEEAIGPLEKALQLKGEHSFLLQTLGICNMRLERYEQAVDAFVRIIKTEKTPELLAKTRLNIGDMYYLMGELGKALDQYSMIALEQDQSTYRLAQHFIKALNHVSDDAKRKMIDDVPFPPRNYIIKKIGGCGSATLKMVLNFLNDPVSQKFIVEKVEDDTNSYAIWNFAVERGFQAYWGVADLPKIKYWINRGYPIIAGILDPKYGWGHVTLIVGYDEIKDIIIAHDVLNWISDREIPTADFQHAWNYYGRESLFIFPADIDLPHNFEANIYAQNCLQTDRGGFLYDQGNKEDAFMELEAAVSNQPPLPITYALLAKLYANENDPKKNVKADQYLSIALSMSSPNGVTLLQAGIFYRIRKENAKATSMFKKGLELYPHSYELRRELASHYLKIRDFANTVIELKKLKTQCNRITECRGQWVINNDLYVSYIFLEDCGGAIQAAQELLKLSSTSKEKLRSHITLFCLNILHKQPKVAKESLHQILALLPDNDPKRQVWNDLLQAMDQPESVVDVKVERDREHARVSLEPFYILKKSDTVADSIAHEN